MTGKLEQGTGGPPIGTAPFVECVSNGQIDELERGLFGRHVAACLEDFSDLSVEVFDGVGGVNHASDFLGKAQERSHLFELKWCLIGESRVPSLSVEESLVVESRGTGIVFIDKGVAGFVLESSDEALSDRVVPAIGLSTHAHRDAVATEHRAMLLACVLRALICVHQIGDLKLLAQRHLQSLLDQACVHVRADRVANPFSCA